MSAQEDTLKRKIAEKREELGSNLREIEGRVRTQTRQVRIGAAVAFGAGVVLALVPRLFSRDR